MAPYVFGVRIPEPPRRCGDRQQKAGAAGVRWAARGCQNAPRVSTYLLWFWALLWLKPGGLWQVFAGPRVRCSGSSVGLGSRRAAGMLHPGVGVAGQAGALQLKGAQMYHESEQHWSV